MIDMPTLTNWLLRPWRERAARAQAAEAKARRLIAEGGREGALCAIRSLRNLAHADTDARREAHALQAALDRLSPAPSRPPHTDTATRMLYGDD